MKLLRELLYLFVRPTKHQYRSVRKLDAFGKPIYLYECIHCMDQKLLDPWQLKSMPPELAVCERSTVPFTFMDLLSRDVDCLPWPRDEIQTLPK